MTISFTPSDSDLGSNLTGEEFLFQFSATGNSSDPVVSMNVVASIIEPTGNVEIIGGTGNTANVQGAYTLALFPNYKFSFVENNTSIITSGTGFPSKEKCKNNEIFELIPDPNQSIAIEYTVTANTSLQSSSKVYDHLIFQNYDNARDFILDCLKLNES